MNEEQANLGEVKAADASKTEGRRSSVQKGADKGKKNATKTALKSAVPPGDDEMHIYLMEIRKK